jgi:murein DD-endopeptidase MepM/ murein hydrolase activator NlpD
LWTMIKTFRSIFAFIIVISFSCDNEETEHATYILPYETGKAFIVIQGNGGSFSHTGAFQYSFDFDMETGTIITAAREGTVTNVEESFTDANRIPGNENFVIIQHDDGTFGRYFHLTKDGALVDVGDEITKGKAIGLSGDTGYSTQPHLHFDVTAGCALPAPDCQTVKIEFINAEDKVPITGKSYEALTY